MVTFATFWLGPKTPFWCILVHISGTFEKSQTAALEWLLLPRPFCCGAMSVRGKGNAKVKTINRPR